jgi:site-specific recombinase XerC
MLVPALHGFFHFLLREDVVAAKPARGTRTPTYPKLLTRRKMDGAFVEAEEVVDRG